LPGPQSLPIIPAHLRQTANAARLGDEEIKKVAERLTISRQFEILQESLVKLASLRLKSIFDNLVMNLSAEFKSVRDRSL